MLCRCCVRVCKLISSCIQHGRTLNREPLEEPHVGSPPSCCFCADDGVESRMDIYGGGGAVWGHTVLCEKRHTGTIRDSERHPPPHTPTSFVCGGSAESRGRVMALLVDLCRCSRESVSMKVMIFYDLLLTQGCWGPCRMKSSRHNIWGQKRRFS